MSTQNKFASGGKIGMNIAPLPNSYNAEKAGGARQSSVNKVTAQKGKDFKPGDNFGMAAISTHNDINTFTRGIKSRGPYGGPTFASLNNYGKMARNGSTSSISSFKTPSGAGTGASLTVQKMYGGSYNDPMKSNPAGSNKANRTTPTVRGGSSKRGGGSSKIGSGSNFTGKSAQMARAGKSNKDGSGYMASVRKGK